MRFLGIFLVFLVAVSIKADDSNSAVQVTYWIGEPDTTAGRTIEGVNLDAPQYRDGRLAQKSSIGNIALNDIVLVNGVLITPTRKRATVVYNYGEATSNIWMRANLIDMLNGLTFISIPEFTARLIADRVIDDDSVFLDTDTITVFRTVDSLGVKYTHPIAGYKRN